MVDDPRTQDARLRADIRRLGNMLGDTLVRQAGPELLDLVEAVRALTKRIHGGGDVPADPGAVGELVDLLSGLDLPTTIQLVRAFSTYFYLANVAEQTNRLDQQGTTGDRSGALESTIDRVIAAGLPRETIAEVVARLELQPGVHRPSHRGGTALDPHQDHPHRRAARRARRPRGDPGGSGSHREGDWPR